MTASKKEVYVLQHVYERADGDEEAKFIGVYTSADLATKASERLRSQPGFREHPDGFQISVYELDKDHWTEGFISWEKASRSS
jgi:hypothetical protein